MLTANPSNPVSLSLDFFVKKLKIQQITLRLAVSFSLVMRRWSDNLKNKVQLMTKTEPVAFTLSLIHKEDSPYGV